MRKKYVLSLDLNTDSESTLIIVSGNEYQTIGAEQRKARLVKSDLMISLSSSGTADSSLDVTTEVRWISTAPPIPEREFLSPYALKSPVS